MKRTRFLVVIAMVLCLLAACGGSPATPTEPATQPPQTQPTDSAPTWTAVLYADFSCGSTEAESIKEYPMEYTGSQKSAQELAQELSLLTGLDFAITVSQVSDGLTVDWAADSTLVAGLDDREQKEEFFFYDIHTLRWFMMDSLWRTLTGNLDVENVYYTMGGGRELSFEELSPVTTFPADIPYMGSGFYYAHSDDVGDDFTEALAATQGLWRLDGAPDTATIEMDGNGSFTMYFADGTIDTIGYLGCEDEYGDGSFRYDMYTQEGEWICGFYFDSPTQFHMGNSEGTVYILDGAQMEYNTYYDENTGFLLSYPTDFSAQGTVDDSGVVSFYTLWDSGMLYWVDPNDSNLSPGEFREYLPLTETMELEGNVVIGYGEIEGGEENQTLSVAYYWVVDTELVVNVMLLCADEQEAAYWYEQFQNRAFYVENAGGAYPIQ